MCVGGELAGGGGDAAEEKGADPPVEGREALLPEHPHDHTHRPAGGSRGGASPAVRSGRIVRQFPSPHIRLRCSLDDARIYINMNLIAVTVGNSHSPHWLEIRLEWWSGFVRVSKIINLGNY